MQDPKFDEEPKKSPWGPPIHSHWLTQEILSISCDIGGGYFVTGESFKQIPIPWRLHAMASAPGWGSHWFEENTAGHGIIITFPELFSEHQLPQALEYAEIHGLNKEPKNSDPE